MIFYFSGVTSPEDVSMLANAGVSHILVDPDDLPALAGWTGATALDSGAYRAFKAGRTLTPDAYLRRLRSILEAHGDRFEFVAPPDVIGNPDLTLENWLQVNGAYNRIIPVWQFGAPETHLQQYLDNAEVVGLGGLVPLIRDKRDQKMAEPEKKAWDKARQNVLNQVLKIAQANPGRFHLFGLCWVKAFNELKPFLRSSDSSLWLEGARYRFAIFQHAKTGKLSHAPAGMISEFAKLDRYGLLTANARNIQVCSSGGSYA